MTENEEPLVVRLDHLVLTLRRQYGFMKRFLA